MTYRIYASLLILSVLGVAIAAALLPDRGWIFPAMVCQAVIFWLLMRAVRVPLRAVENGIYLLREQDFTTRLRRTGQHDADAVVSLFNTLTDTMRSERLKTLEQEKFMEQLIEASPLGIAICDFNRKIIRRNKAFDTLADNAVNATLETLADGQSVVIRPAPSLVLRCARLSFMDSGYRRPYYLVEPLTDEVRAAESAVFNKIVRTIGHEVNNTLGSVMSVLESVGELYAGDENVSETLASSHDRCLQLVDFVSSYADIVKLPSPELRPLELNGWVDSLLPFLGVLAGRYITVISGHSASDCVVQADASMLERVLINIVKNAAESIGDRGGQIKVTVGDRQITVTDNGPGISAADAQQLFTPFFSTKKVDRGLGLMLVAEVLRRHGATYSLSTDTTDGLTRFTITFGA